MIIGLEKTKTAVDSLTESPDYPNGPIRTHWVKVNGLNTFYRTAGKKGDILLLIHGGGSDYSGFIWKHTLPALATRFRVIALDLPGYGSSELPNLLPDQSILSFHSNFICEFLDELNIAKAHICGFSMGGGIALGFALAHPERIKKLVLVNSYGLEKPVFGGLLTYLITRVDPLWLSLRWLIRHNRYIVRRGLRWSICDPENITDELVDDAFQALRLQRLHPAWRIFQHQEITLQGFRTTFLDDLEGLAKPTLFILSENDELIPHKLVKPALQQLKNARLYIARNAGHLLPREKPAEFNRVLMDYLSDNFVPKTGEKPVTAKKKDSSVSEPKPDTLP